MKKYLLTFIIVLSGWYVNAQTTTNTFPTTGNAGIGTTAPGANLVIQATTPELRFITTADSTNFARFLRSTASSNNLFTGRNKVLQAGAIGKAVNLAGISYTGSDAGFPIGSSVALSVSVWIKTHTVSSGVGAIFGYGGSGGLGFQIGGGGPGTMYLTQSGIVTQGGNYPTDTLWHHLAVTINGIYLSVYVDGALHWSTTVSYSTVTLNGVFKNADPFSAGTIASFDQLLVYNRAISSSEVAQIYGVAGNGTGLVPPSGLIRRYDFDDAAGNTAVDGNPTSSVYPLTLSSSTALLYPGKVPISTSPSESTFFSISDGVTNGEKGIDTWGDGNGRNQQMGKWFQWQQGSNYPLISNNAGQWLFNPNNTSASLPTVASTIDVAGNVTVGSAYASVNAAPKDGLIVQGNTGIGTPTPAYPLQINQPLSGQGTISVTASSGAVTGAGTKFLADFNVGDTIKANSEIHVISAIASNTALTTNNWTSTFNGTYTTTNPRRYTFSGKGSLYLGDPQSSLSSDAFIQTIKTFNNNNSPISGITTNITANQTTGPTSSALTGASTIVAIGGTNNKSWTVGGLTASNSRAAVQVGASGTFNSLTGNQSAVANLSALDTINTATAYSGNVNNRGLIKNAYFSSGTINNNISAVRMTNAYLYAGNINSGGTTLTNATGLYLTGMASATNNTGVYLTTANTTNIPAGNWAVFDTTGYKSYFAGSIGIGTTDSKGYKLAVNGSAIAISVVVKAYANWPDYIFKKDHVLMPLADLKAYVDKNQHLPEIPSAAEVEKNGQDLGEMNKLLVKKMEEMTLYMIEKDKQIKDQQAELKAQEQRLKTLEQKIEKIAKKD